MHLKDEIDFKDVIKSPLRLFGLSYFYFLFAGGFLGAFYIWNMNTISHNEIAPIIPQDSSIFIQDIPMARGALIAPVNVTEVGKPSKALIDKGANLYKANCASCHGETGMGDGVTAATLSVKPRNFHMPDGWKNGRKVSQMYQTLQNGIIASGMPSFNYFPAEDRFAIIHYVRTFATDYPVDQLDELLALEQTYQLSKGTQLPPQIPISMAIDRLDAECQTTAVMIEEQYSTMVNEDNAVKILKSVARDEKKIFTAASKIAGSRSLDDFITIVSSDPVTLGFKAEVVRLSSNDWNSLYSYFSKLPRTKKNS